MKTDATGWLKTESEPYLDERRASSADYGYELPRPSWPMTSLTFPEFRLPEHSAYRLTNYDKQENYFGVTNDFDRRQADQASGSTKALKHWNFANDYITEKLVDAFDDQRAASAAAHDWEQIYADNWPAFFTHQTAGI